MDYENMIARCGLACFLCTAKTGCPGCKSDACPDRSFCVNRGCSMEKGIDGCYACSETDCKKGMLSKVKPCAFTEFARTYGIEALIKVLTEKEKRGLSITGKALPVIMMPFRIRKT